jgi:hypothetical protein
MEAVRTSETSVHNHFTRQYNPEDNSEHHTRRRENLKSHITKRRFDRKFFRLGVFMSFSRHFIMNDMLNFIDFIL